VNVVCYIGLGSNVGDRLEHLRHAVTLLDATDGIDVVVGSSVYETEPVGPPQPDFLNAVVEIRTSLGAPDLLRRLKEIEAEIGREPTGRWGPREIDLDLLTYGDESIDGDDLRVPHPRMAERAFVLVPLAEIASDVRLAAGSPSELLEALGDAGVRAIGERLR
jgi:2-amino-4-hydroxy-6-hydroxymethyldihydropteridine diphosphokinase